jgi:hypothetical protein
MLCRQTTGLFASKLRCFADVTDPATNAPERMYRGDGGLVKPIDMVPGTFDWTTSTIDSLADRLELQYDLHRASGLYVDKVYCNHLSTNLDTEDTLYKGACANTRSQFNVRDRTMTFTADYIRDKPTADSRLKYIINQRRTLQNFVEVDLWGDFVDLKPGHVLTFDDNLATDQEMLYGGEWRGLTYPGAEGAADWSSHTWNAMNVGTTKPNLLASFPPHRDPGGGTPWHRRA